MAVALIWVVCIFLTIESIGTVAVEPREYNGFCINTFCNSMNALKKLQNCRIVVGDLKILLMERTKAKDFTNISFPLLKEVTGFVVLYRVAGLESLGQLFPNLSRIRGSNLLYNYALIVYDMQDLKEIGLFNLLKIDRGGVIIWGGPLTCFVDTIDWNVIAPNSRHVLSTTDIYAECNMKCTCTTNSSTNHCWNNRKCQRLLEGPDSEICSSECLGCRNTNQTSCSLCRDFIYRNNCVPRCPDDTSLLSVSNYCVTIEECEHLNRWAWNGKCVSECPENYILFNEMGNVTCVPCEHCHKTCGNLYLQTLAAIQEARKCVYVKGSLKIHVASVPNLVNELRFYLKNIVEVSDYIIIYGTLTLNSLDFLSSLQRIRGLRLHSDKYSLVVHDMHNLQTLFLPNVTQNLKIENGTLKFYRNPMLCMNQIEKLKALFPVAPSEIDIPQGLNGYSGTCKDVSLCLHIRVMNETSAIATFFPSEKSDVHYTILYVKIPHGTNASVVPETCSEFEWNAINIPSTSSYPIQVSLSRLRPASRYVACIEVYEPSSRYLARSPIVNFTTQVGKPKPPFIIELAASSWNSVSIRWVDHVDYKPHIDRYELDLYLVDVYDGEVINKKHCLIADNNLLEIDHFRHAKVMRPPKNYHDGCESMCGILSTVTVGAMVEDTFDICSILDGCENEDIEVDRPRNITKEGNIKSLSLDLDGTKNYFHISGLAPFRDYKFELRACIQTHCSRTVRESVRTLRSKSADIVTLVDASGNSTGHINVQWDPPKMTNGPILCYNLEVYPNIKLNDVSRVLPQVWCFSSNETNVTVKSTAVNKYLVKVCVTSLGSSYLCTDWKKIDVNISEDMSVNNLETRHWNFSWLNGIFIGILIYTVSIAIGCIFRLRKSNDNIPLVDTTSEYRNESEPPAVMLSDFAPLYNIPYRDSHL